VTLQLDLDAGAFVGSTGAAVGAAGSGFPDVSGWNREFRQATAGNRPTYSPTVMNGLPGIVFDGVDDYLTGQGILSQYYGASGFAMLAVFRPLVLAAAGAHDYDDAAVWTDTAGYTGLSLSTGLVTGWLYDSGGDKKRTGSISPNQVCIVAVVLDGGQLKLAVNGGAYGTPLAAGAPATMTGSPIMGKAFSAATYASVAVARLRLWDALPAPFETYRSELLATYGLQRLAGLEDARDLGSRIVREGRQPSATVRRRVRFAVGLGLEPGDVVWLSDPELPHPQGLGAGTATWQRWPTYLIERTANPGSLTHDLALQRFLPFSVWWVPHTPASGLAQQQGVLRILSGQTWTYQRASTAYVEDPSDGTVLEVPIDVEPIGRYGMLAEGARTHGISNCCFADGTTGWSSLVGHSLDTSVLFFKPSVTAQSLKLTFSPGTPGEATTTLVSGGAQYWYLSIRHLDGSGAALDWRLQRSSDGKYWDNTTSTWVASSATVNFLPTATTKQRDFSQLIDAGAAPGTFTLRVRNGVAGSAWVGSVQLEAGRWPTSDMPTRASTTFSRAAGQLLCSNNSSARAWNAPKGTARITLNPWWNSTEVGSTAFTLVWISYDANNSVRLWYDGSAGAWKFSRKRAGTTTTASVTAAVTRGTPVELVVRWCGTDLELGKVAYAGSVFAAGVAGTDDTTAAGAPTEVATCNVELGSGSSAYAEGHIQRLLLTPAVLLDEEAARPD
jgi:hypothetical protein